MTTKDDKEKAKISRETLGKYFYDLSKTCFASFVVANVIAIFAAENIVTPIILALYWWHCYVYIGKNWILYPKKIRKWKVWLSLLE